MTRWDVPCPMGRPHFIFCPTGTWDVPLGHGTSRCLIKTVACFREDFDKEYGGISTILTPLVKILVLSEFTCKFPLLMSSNSRPRISNASTNNKEKKNLTYCQGIIRRLLFNNKEQIINQIKVYFITKKKRRDGLYYKPPFPMCRQAFLLKREIVFSLCVCIITKSRMLYLHLVV
jgi:hypothetical protein